MESKELNEVNLTAKLRRCRLMACLAISLIRTAVRSPSLGARLLPLGNGSKGTRYLDAHF